MHLAMAPHCLRCLSHSASNGFWADMPGLATQYGARLLSGARLGGSQPRNEQPEINMAASITVSRIFMEILQKDVCRGKTPCPAIECRAGRERSSVSDTQAICLHLPCF